MEIIDLYQKAKALRSDAHDNAASIAVFDEAIGLARKIESPDFEAKCLRQQSVSYFNLENLEAYRDLNRRALAIFLRLKNRRDAGVCRNNIGIYHLKIDDYAEALAQTEAALAVAREFGDPVSITDSLNNLSLIYADLGEFDKAVKALDEVLAIDTALGDPALLGIDLNNLGTVHRRKGLLNDDRGEFETAARLFEQALAKIAAGTDFAMQALYSNNIGSAYSQLGEYDKALAAFGRGQGLAERAEKDKPGGGKEVRSIILNNIGLVYARLGEYARSTGYYEQAIDLALEGAGKRYLWEIYLELGNARRGLGRTEEAAEDYRASIAIIEDIRATISTEELRATYFGSDKRLDAYANLIDLLAGGEAPAASRAEEAFETMEKAKARSFLDTLEVRAVMNQRPEADARSRNREKELLSDLSRAYRALLGPDEAGGRKAAVRARIESIEDDLERLRREMRRADPALAGLKYPSAATLAEAQAALPDNRTKAIAFMLGKDKSYAFALDKAGLKVYPLPPREQLEAQVEAYVLAISDPTNTDFQAGVDLFEALLEPGLDEKTEKLVIVPDGILYYLPFEALPRSRTAQGTATRWLVQDYEVSYAPSLSSYREIRERARRTHARTQPALLAVGAPAYPTPESAREAERLVQGLYPDLGQADLASAAGGREMERLAALFPADRRTILSGTAATEQAFATRSAERFRIVHIAAHGLVDDRKPMRSALLLAPGPAPEADGLLQTREVMDLRLADGPGRALGLPHGAGAAASRRGHRGLEQGLLRGRRFLRAHDPLVGQRRGRRPPDGALLPAAAPVRVNGRGPARHQGRADRLPRPGAPLLLGGLHRRRRRGQGALSGQPHRLGVWVAGRRRPGPTGPDLSCRPPPRLAREPLLVLERQHREGHDPPQQEGRDQPVRNPIQEGQALVRPQVVQRQDERRDDQEGHVPEHEQRVEGERVQHQAQREEVERVEEVEEDEVDDRQNPVASCGSGRRRSGPGRPIPGRSSASSAGTSCSCP